VLNDSGQPAPSSGIRIAGNTTYGNSLGGIEVNSGTGAGGSHSNVTIIGNHSYGNTLANATQQGEVKVDHVNQAQVARSGTTRRPRRWPSLNGTAGAGWTTVGNTLGATIGASDSLAAPIASLGAAPVPSGCATGRVVATGSTATRGTVTEGSRGTGCVINSTTFTSVPFCTVSSPNGSPVTSHATTATTLTITNPSGAANQYSWACLQ
jgi:hypothetical protein